MYPAQSIQISQVTRNHRRDARVHVSSEPARRAPQPSAHGSWPSDRPRTVRPGGPPPRRPPAGIRSAQSEGVTLTGCRMDITPVTGKGASFPASSHPPVSSRQ